MITEANDKTNYYEVLEVQTYAPQGDIDTAYRRALNAYSDDSVALYSLLSADECTRMRNMIEEAYSIIGDALKRREYDQARGFNRGEGEHIYSRSHENKNVASTLSAPPTTTSSAFTDKVHEQLSEFINFYGGNALHKNSDVNKNIAYKKFGLDYDFNAELESRIEAATDFPGAFLREIREYKKVSLERMAEMTKILKTYVIYIENEAYDKLPATVYARGFVYQYAKCLKLNPDLVSNSYVRKIKASRGEK